MQTQINGSTGTTDRATVLVTGATGFIGSRLLTRLVGLKARVHATYRTEAPALEESVTWWKVDLAHRSTTFSVIREVRPDIVYHLAAAVTGSRNIEYVARTFRDNCAATVNLLEAVAGAGCRKLVVAGSMEESGFGASPEPPSSPYAASKEAATTYLRLFHALYGVPVVHLRIFMVYGPGQRDLTKLVPYSTLAFLKGEAPLVTSGRRRIDWIYVEDVVDAMTLAASSTPVAGVSVDIGSGKPVSIREMLGLIRRETKAEVRPRFGSIPDRPLDADRIASLEEADSLLNWRPSTSIRKGIRQTVDWYRRQT